MLASTGVPGAEGSTGLDMTSILANIGTGGVSGAALTAIIALIKNAVQKS